MPFSAIAVDRHSTTTDHLGALVVKPLLSVGLLVLALNTGSANGQLQFSRVPSTNADLSTLEGVTLSNGNSSMLILANATIQRPSAPANGVTANAVVAPTFLKKVGPFEVHRATPASAATLANAQEAMTLNGKSLPVFANMGTGQDFVGAAYMNDTQQIGLISKEVSVKFKTGGIPADYAGFGAKELVPRSGLFVFTVADIYAWIKLVSRLQADPQVSMVEPRIVTEFAQPQ
jgi:hypothetical protein